MILLLATLAEAAEYRRVELSDGRFLLVEILANDATGVDVALPQGRLRLSYDRVLRLEPINEEQYLSQPPLRVLVLPFTAADGAAPALADEARERVWETLANLPSIERHSLSEMGGYAPSSALTALSACGADPGCVGSRVASLDVDVVIAGTVRGESAADVALAAAWPLYTDVRTLVAGSVGPDGTPPELAWRLVHASLGLLPGSPPVPAAPPEPWSLLATPPVAPSPDPPPGPPPEPVLPLPADPLPGSPPPGSGSNIRPGLAFVPVPGFAQWVGGDPRRALGATALVLPGTAGLVYLSGAGTTRRPEAITLSALGYYGLCVVTGRAFVPVVAPTDGGLTVGAGGRF